MNKDGTAIDAMIGKNDSEAIKVKQSSLWTYDEDKNIFKQDIKEISIQVGNEESEISHPNEIMTSSIFEYLLTISTQTKTQMV
ncbi:MULTISPECIES: hypothetical protein [Providencia]|uniref:hypothetical protein n=1 Tax=Providencia TaxID=586 RepID=UPI001419B99F|nr:MULTISPECIES: hypothetical protein [Providencia]EJD6082054.1 hypothetical protein [Providencia rettgeri]EJD6401119.1 hypothetical protein [Providencia rettgeri]EJD6598835.1 hypothetical protein [Providencia rettgeri]EJD6612815.1 hypothetical protein [Providencia rettgeri]ELL9149844.1 hypothetical protein [Providencia rettgeri]